jgi:tetratricopeptide (TPR) repeat protein
VLWVAEHDDKRRGVAFDANHLGKLERGSVRCPRQLYVRALCAVLDATPAELGFDGTASALATRPLLALPDSGGPSAGEVSANPDDWERMTFAACHPRQVDAATIDALADVLAATRHIEDQIGSADVLPSVQAHRGLAANLLANARSPMRDRLGSLTGELHQYLGWLLAETGHLEQARAELNAALALGVEFDDPDLTSLALSFKGHLAWMVGNPHGVIALSGAARRDTRVFIAQHAFNAHQQARGWAMAGERGEVDRALAHADTLAERALTRQADAPSNLYWYSSGFFTLQRGLTWHTLGDTRVAARAATELINGRHELPAAERDSEWAAIFTVAAAEALTTAGEVERAIAQARQAVAVCRATRSTRLARALKRAHTLMQDTWPTHATIRELGEEIRPLNGTN